MSGFQSYNNIFHSVAMVTSFFESAKSVCTNLWLGPCKMFALKRVFSLLKLHDQVQHFKVSVTGRQKYEGDNDEYLNKIKKMNSPPKNQGS